MEITEVTKESLLGTLPKRKEESHKGDYGRLLLICGSVGFTGAPWFAAEAAVKSGAGLVFLLVPRDIYTVTAVKCREAMPFPLQCDEKGRISEASEEEILKRLKDCDACLVGPGLGRSEGVSKIVFSVIRNCKVPLVLDADGINAVSENINILDEAACPIILTPHEGEFSRLGGELENGRELSAAKFAAERKCTLVLKGNKTLTAFSDGRIYRNLTGNPGMAKGGSGDVLSGILTSLLGQKLDFTRSILSAVWLHGRAGDICEAKFGEYSMTPTDLIYALPSAFMELESR